ncbi:hypothetical protein GPJ56_002269 [Histomonas meleagridis]|uniref:uncharacterized protein n=1 Tax=Histomonas meleagridis TaxID=135588 RepID=UPI003559457F|nr:hypothetical protein GPJ56_002269 [Histomonas meleagridis]KAH0802961.1 hypothetical protein GO595_004468 [Histomonas meleagridis]
MKERIEPPPLHDINFLLNDPADPRRAAVGTHRIVRCTPTNQKRNFLFPLVSAYPISQSSAVFDLSQPIQINNNLTNNNENETNISLVALCGVRNSVGTSLPRFQICKPMAERSFDEVVNDGLVTINPIELGFIPKTMWENEYMSFGSVVSSFFRKRNSSQTKFTYKLYNALKLSEKMPEFIPHVGIEWATDTIIRVHREAFARLLGVKTIEGSLFHQQGNFPSHGFTELSFRDSDNLSRALGWGPADLSVVRFVTHANGKFSRGSSEKDLKQCKWTRAATTF